MNPGSDHFLLFVSTVDYAKVSDRTRIPDASNDLQLRRSTWVYGREYAPPRSLRFFRQPSVHRFLLVRRKPARLGASRSEPLARRGPAWAGTRRPSARA